ncbi:phosphoribosyltransferase [Comamonas endophytica]|uniref:phosphoribosyltransferase n=1 Tax=Comamonas endophytica TaxID=2949090 RepID=UPI003612D26F
MVDHLLQPASPDFDATTGYWQRILSANELAQSTSPPYQRSYPARLRDGRYLLLPLRGLPGDATRCMTSLVANQAALEVVQALTQAMVEQARDFPVDAVVGLPTLGLSFAPAVARGLGHARFVPLGFSRKYWYRDELSEPVRSISSPGQDKRLYLDPHQASLLDGRRVLVVDDTVSTGATMLSALRRAGGGDRRGHAPGHALARTAAPGRRHAHSRAGRARRADAGARARRLGARSLEGQAGAACWPRLAGRT